MRLFNRNPRPDVKIPSPVASRVEIEVAKDANKEVKEAAKQVNETVKELLVDNGFTLKIYLAAGGSIKGKTVSHGH